MAATDTIPDWAQTQTNAVPDWASQGNQVPDWAREEENTKTAALSDAEKEAYAKRLAADQVQPTPPAGAPQVALPSNLTGLKTDVNQLIEPLTQGFAQAGKLAEAGLGDIAAGFSGAARALGAKSLPQGQEVSGNILAFLTNKPLPIEQTVAGVSQDPNNVAAAAAAKFALGVAQTAPMAAIGGLPAGIQKVLVAGFTADMVKELPKTAAALGEEMGKPNDQQDPDKISSLVSDAAQQLLFGAGGIKHFEGLGREKLTDLLVRKYVPQGTGVASTQARINADLLNQQLKGAPYASEKPSTTQLPQLEVRPQVGGEAPLRQQGEAAGARQAQGVGAPEKTSQVLLGEINERLQEIEVQHGPRHVLDLKTKKFVKNPDSIRPKEEDELLKQAAELSKKMAKQKSKVFTPLHEEVPDLPFAAPHKPEAQSPELNPEHYTTPENRLIKDPINKTKRGTAARYFHDAGDATKTPDFWRHFFVKAFHRGDFSQETAYQAGLYLRQLGEEKAAPVIKAMDEARQQMGQIGRASKDANEKAAHLSQTQYLREAVESARDELSGAKVIPESMAKPLAKFQAGIEEAVPAASPAAYRGPVREMSPENKSILDENAKHLDVPVETYDGDALPPTHPYAYRLRRGMATIDPPDPKTGYKGKVIIDNPSFDRWVGDLPESQKGKGTRSVLGEERIHLGAWGTRMDEDGKDITGKTYWGFLSNFEKRTFERVYRQGEDVKLSENQLGHEAIRFRMQRMARMTPLEVIAATGKEKWKRAGLLELANIVGHIRRTIKPNVEERAILDQIQSNVGLALRALENQLLPNSPANQDLKKEAKSMHEREADHLESQADMYIASGDAKSGEELKEMAKRLRQQADEKSFPMARPRKRSESVFQDKFILPGEETKKVAGLTKAVGYEGEETPPVPQEQRVSAEAAGALPRLTGQALSQRAASWVQKAFSDSLAALHGGEKLPLPKFKDFADFMKRQDNSLKPGQLFEMWQDIAAKSFDNLPGEELRLMGKTEFGGKVSRKRVEELSKITDPEERLKEESRREGARSVWDRQVPDKPPVGSGIIHEYRELERRAAVQQAARDELAAQELHNPEDLKKMDEELKDVRWQARRIAKDYQAAINKQNWRNRIVSALYRRMIKPVLAESDERLNRKEVNPQDIRFGGGGKISAYEDLAGLPERKLAEGLVDKSRRTRDDPNTITRRLVVLQNPRTGTVHMVSAYEHPGKIEVNVEGNKFLEPDVRILDPISPTREHVPLDSIKNRYRLLQSVLLDEPVRKFREDFKSLADYNARFGDEARAGEDAHQGYQPESISKEEFMQEVGGRIESGEGGSFQGPHRELVGDTGPSAMEQTRTSDITDAEARSLSAHIFGKGGRTKSQPQIKEALMSLGESKNRQAISAVAKIARAFQRKFPDLSTEQLLDFMANRLKQNHELAADREDFSKRMSDEIAGGEEDLPMALNRQKPKVNPDDKPAQFAKMIDDSLFRLHTQHQADVELAFPKMREIRDEEKKFPEGTPKKIRDYIDDNLTLRHSDVDITLKEEPLLKEAERIYSENKTMFKYLRQTGADVNEDLMFSRMAKDPNNLFARILRKTKRGILEGNVLKPTAWFTKNRKLKAITDDQGNRRVVAIVGTGKNSSLIAYDKGKAENMGPFSRSGLVRRHKLLDDDLKDLREEAEKLTNEKNILEKTAGRKASAARRLASIDRRLGEISQESKPIIDSHLAYEGDLNDRAWVDKNGKRWSLGEASIREIESNMDVRFHEDPFPVLIHQNLQLKSMLRAAKWLEEFKSSEPFGRVAIKAGERNIPPDWKANYHPDRLPSQLRGYVFEPKLADTLEQFQSRSQGSDPSEALALNRLLQNAVFLANPFLHTPNLLGWWSLTRGASKWINPLAYYGMGKSGIKAYNDVINRSPEYIRYLKAGAPFQNTRMQEFSQNVAAMLQKEIEGEPTLGRKVANIAGYANPIKLSQSIGKAATAGLHDMLTLQLIHEVQLRNPGMRASDVIKKVTATMPDYRMPARILNNRRLSKFLQNKNWAWFAAYHYSEGRAFINMAKGLAGKGDLSRSEAMDRIAALAILMAVAYPILDAIFHKVVGRQDLSLRRAGPTTWPHAIAGVAEGKLTPVQATPSFFSLSPGISGFVSLLFNRDVLHGGLPIYNPKAGLGQGVGDVARFAGSLLNPIQMYNDLKNGRMNWDQIFLNLMGIRRDYSHDPEHQIYGMAYDWAQRTGNQKLLSQFNQRAEEVYPASAYGPLKNDLARGNNRKALNDIVKLKRQGKTDAQIERELRPDAHPMAGLKEFEGDFEASLNPQQRRVFEQAMANREKVYDTYLELSR
jgi:hypothetical protein